MRASSLIKGVEAAALLQRYYGAEYGVTSR